MDFTGDKKRKAVILSFLIFLAAINMSAQFSYSLKIGCGWTHFHNNDYEIIDKKRPGITFGADIDYHFNSRVGVQTGLNYRSVSYKGLLAIPSSAQFPDINIRVSYLEIPLLATIKITNSTPKIMDLIIGAGPYVDFKIHQKIDERSQGFKTYPGLMATAQLEFVSHYFIRAEHQWGLLSDREKKFSERRANMFSVVAGYRF